MARTSSKSLIIDVAEELMALEGIDHISIRRVNEKTGLSPAAVHYHFKNKSELVSAVLLKHLRDEPQRNAMKNKLLHAPETLTAERLITAMLNPIATILLEDGINGEYFAKLIAQLYSHKRQQLSESMPIEFQQMAELDFQLFSLFKPELSAYELQTQFSFISLCIVDAVANFRETVQNIKTLDHNNSDLLDDELVVAKKRFLEQLHLFLVKAVA